MILAQPDPDPGDPVFGQGRYQAARSRSGTTWAIADFCLPIKETNMTALAQLAERTMSQTDGNPITGADLGTEPGAGSTTPVEIDD
jgi:hypothetical protein